MRKGLLVVIGLALAIELMAVFLFNQEEDEDSISPRFVPQPEAIANTPPAREGVPLSEYGRIGEVTRAAAYRPDVPNRPLGDKILQVTVDDAGRPAAGVPVRVDQRPLDTPRRLRGFDQESYWTGTTGSDGVATFTTLPAGRVIVRAMGNEAFAIGAAEMGSDAAEQQLRLSLSPVSGASGYVVTESGTPAADVLVFALDASQPDTAPANLLFAFPERTDTAGTFAFPYFPAPARLVAWKDGAALAVSDLVMPASEGTRLVLGPGVTLTGRLVQGGSEKAVPNVRVDLAGDLGLAPESAVTTADGSFVFRNLRPVEYWLYVQNRDYALQAPVPALTVNVAAAPDVLTIPLERTGYLRGRFLDSDTEAGVTGAPVEISSATRGTFTVATDQGGYYFFDGLPSGTYTLRAPESADYGVLNPEALEEQLEVKPAEQTAGPVLRVRRLSESG
ncbi:MAG: carboxypeptidase regulatory-like domain-containing protein [Candidatus Hydrogenedentes bacterium]|nr:carboxypeptidase regulatory-like domain-containing protein [Candidatus Hydrogenedentota bacterium]